MIKNAATVFSKWNLFGRIVAAKLKDPYFPLKHAIWKFDCFKRKIMLNFEKG